MKYHQKTTRVITLVIGAFLWCASLLFPQDSFAVVTTLYEETFNQPLQKSWQVVWNQQWGNVRLPCLTGTTPSVWQQNNGKLGIIIDGPPCVIDIAPTALNLRKVGKYKVHFSVEMKDSAWMNRSVAVLWQDPQNWYDVMLYGDSIYVQKYINGQYSILTGPISYPFQANQTYSFSVEVTQGQGIEVTINNQKVVVAQDKPPFLTPEQKKTVALRGSVGAASRSVSWFDDLKITADLEPSELISLNVSLFKQTDARWRELEYDSAKKWSDAPTIGRWGCAMTSMVMIMQYHGISQLPDGKVITPETLNQWLKDEPDGYISGGINWLAVTRLTRLISEKLKTPKLEFSRASGKKEDVIKWATEEIEDNKPVILGVPGHFFVADGINTAAETLLIKDPAFKYDLLSQHKTDVDSIRRFEPSQTDLSYIMFVVPKKLSIEVKDQAGEVLPVERSSEYIESFSEEISTGDGKQSPALEQVLLRKPESGTYSIHLSQPEQEPYQLQIYSYDALGNVQVQEKNGQSGPEGSSFSLSYKKDKVTQPPKQKTWKVFLKELRLFIKQKHFKHRFVALYIEQLALEASIAKPKQQKLYIRVIEHALSIYQPFIHRPTYRYLQQELKGLKKQNDK